MQNIKGSDLIWRNGPLASVHPSVFERPPFLDEFVNVPDGRGMVVDIEENRIGLFVWEKEE